jgi:hypothetical protein
MIARTTGTWADRRAETARRTSLSRRCSQSGDAHLQSPGYGTTPLEFEEPEIPLIPWWTRLPSALHHG